MRGLLRVYGLEKTTEAFRRKLIRISEAIGLDPSFIAAVIAFETVGTFSPTIRPSPGSSHVGLLQFGPEEAKALGTSTSQLLDMTATKQLSYVKAYFLHYKKRIRPTEPLDYYLAVFSPKWIGSPASAVMYSLGEPAYEQNKGLDVDGDGAITVGDVSTRFMRIIIDAQAREPLAVDVGGSAGSKAGWFAFGGIVALAITVWTLSRMHQTMRRETETDD